MRKKAFRNAEKLEKTSTKAYNIQVYFCPFLGVRGAEDYVQKS